MVFALFIAVVMMIPKVVAEYGLRKYKTRAKIWTFMASCLAVLSISFGLVLGIYGFFWFIFGDAGKEYFRTRNQIRQIQRPPSICGE